MTLQRFVEILRAKQLSLDEFSDLSSAELKALEAGLDSSLTPRKLIPLGDTCFIRSESVESLEYIEGTRFLTHAPVQMALILLEFKGALFAHQIRDHSPTLASIKKHVYENDLALHLKHAGVALRGFRIDLRQNYYLDEDKWPKDLPGHMSRIVHTEHFDADLIPTEPLALAIPNSASLRFFKEDLIYDLSSGHNRTEVSWGYSIAGAQGNKTQPSSGFKITESLMSLQLDLFYDTASIKTFDGNQFVCMDRCSKREGRIIARWKD